MSEAAGVPAGVPSAVPAPVVPASVADLSDESLLDLYERGVAAPWVRVNFVTTLDGSATADGLSGSLGGDDDSRVFDLLRRTADVVLVAAGTVRDEGYGPMVLGEADVAWRRARGMPDHPVFAIVSGSLSIDPGSRVFVDAPVRPVVLTTGAAAASARGASLSAVADVVACDGAGGAGAGVGGAGAGAGGAGAGAGGAGAGGANVDVRAVRAALVERGLGRIHCEGGPGLFGSLVAADLVDELCLTIDPTLEGGAGPRITRPAAVGGSAAGPVGGPAGGPAGLRRLRLAHALLGADDVLLTRYVRTTVSR